MQIFLSHASQSKTLVRRLVDPLPAHVHCWLDQDELLTGHVFGPRIVAAIEQDCDFLVAFIDRHALASAWVPREIELGLRREVDLERTFVLPILLEDVRDRLHEAGEIGDRLHLTAFEHDDASLARTSRALADQLFALASRSLEKQRDRGRRGLLAAFANELTAYKQAAFRWRAALGFGVAVLSTNQEAFDHVRDSVDAYNRVSDPFIARLPLHRDRIGDAFAAHRGLCHDLRDLIGRIEQVYRGEMYRLNEIHGIVQEAVSHPPSDKSGFKPLDARRERILAEAGAALDAVSEQATRLIAHFEREIE